MTSLLGTDSALYDMIAIRKVDVNNRKVAMVATWKTRSISFKQQELIRPGIGKQRRKPCLTFISRIIVAVGQKERSEHSSGVFGTGTVGSIMSVVLLFAQSLGAAGVAARARRRGTATSPSASARLRTRS